MIDDFVIDDGNSILGFELGFLLFCGLVTVRKMSSTSPYKEYSVDEYVIYNITKYSDLYWKALVMYIRYSHSNTLTMCEVMRLAAESLMYDGKLRNDVDFNFIALGLKQYI